MIQIHEKNYAGAAETFARLRDDLIKATKDTPTNTQAWADLYLLTVSAIRGRAADVAKYERSLEQQLKELPSAPFIGWLAAPVRDAAAGRDPAPALAAARAKLGPNYPDLKFFESLLPAIKTARAQ